MEEIKLRKIIVFWLYVSLLALGFWVWSVRIDYCKQFTDRPTWQCVLITAR